MAFLWLLSLTLQRWNDTYFHFHKVDPKQTYYLSMEFLQGRALINAIGNLDLLDPYAEALKKLGYDLENIADQVRASSFCEIFVKYLIE